MALSIRLGSFSFPDLITPSDTAKDIQYELSVSNDGNEAVTSVVVSNNITTFQADVDADGFNLGDENQNNILDPGESWDYFAEYLVTDADFATRQAIVSTTTVTASNAGGSVSAIRTDSAALGSFKPAVALAQTPAPNPAGAGTTVTFGIKATNTGNCALEELELTSSLAGPVVPQLKDGFNSGDLDRDDVFDVGETWNFSASTTVTQDDITNNGNRDGTADGALTNTVTARGRVFGEDAGQEFSISNSAKVDLITGPPPHPPKPPCHPCLPCPPKPICKPQPKSCFLFGGWKPFLGGRQPAQASSGWSAATSGGQQGGLFRSGRWDWWSGANVVSSPFQRSFGGWFR